MLIELSDGRLSIEDRHTDDLEKMVGENEIERISKIIEAKLENNMNKYIKDGN